MPDTIDRIKISDLTATRTVKGLWTMVTNATTNASRRIKLDVWLKVLYAHCGGDTDTATMEQPAILRGNPEAVDAQHTPRFILYFDGYLYDNAPADYAGGEYI